MTKRYSLGIDGLRVLAILAVVLIHTSILSIQAIGHDISRIPLTYFLNQIGIFAVPLFFLISGFVLELHYKDRDYLTYFKKRTSRILIPYIFWTCFYFWAYPQTIPKNTSFFFLLLTGKAAYQLYFIPAIILFYLLFPLLHKYYSVITNKSVMLVLFILEIVLQAYDYFYGPLSTGNVIRVTLLSFIMFPFGMIAAHHEEKIFNFTKKHSIPLFITTVVVLGCILAEGWYYYLMTQKPQAIYSQYNAFVIPYTILIGLLFFSLFSQVDRLKPVIMRLSKLSFFVFFIHVSIIYTFWNILKRVSIQTQSSTIDNFIFTLFFFLFVSGMSFLIADLTHRIPYLSKITG